MLPPAPKALRATIRVDGFTITQPLPWGVSLMAWLLKQLLLGVGFLIGGSAAFLLLFAIPTLLEMPPGWESELLGSLFLSLHLLVDGTAAVLLGLLGQQLGERLQRGLQARQPALSLQGQQLHLGSGERIDLADVTAVDLSPRSLRLVMRDRSQRRLLARGAYSSRQWLAQAIRAAKATQDAGSPEDVPRTVHALKEKSM